MAAKRTEELVGATTARLLAWWGIGLRITAAISVFLVIWVLGFQQRNEKERQIKPVEYIGHSDEAAYATGGVSLAEGRGLSVPYVSYFFNAYQPWEPGEPGGGGGVWRREDHWPPFMDFAIAPCVYFWGKATWICKLPAIFFGSIGLPLTTALLAYALSRRGYVAIVAGLIMMTNSLIYEESLKTLSDVSTGMLVAGFAACVILAQRKPWMHILAGAFLAGAYFSKGSQLLLLGMYPLMAMLCTGPNVFFRKSFWAGMFTALFLMAPYWYGNWKAYGYAFHSTQNYVSGWYAIDGDWESRAYFPYWGKNLPKTSDLWTPLPPLKPGDPPRPPEVEVRASYAPRFWRSSASTRLAYMGIALGGSAWQDFGNLGLWWRDAINQLPVDWIAWWKSFSFQQSLQAFAQPPAPGPTQATGSTPPTPAFSWRGIAWLFQRSTFNVPLLTRQVDVPFFSDLLRRWSRPPTSSGQPEPIQPPPAQTPVANWPFARLAGLGTVWLISIALFALPAVIVIGAAKWLWRFYYKSAGLADDPVRAAPVALEPVWFPGPVVAVALLLVMEVGFLAYFWATAAGGRFYLPFIPLTMALGCAAFSLLFEVPFLLLIAGIRSLVSASVWPFKNSRTIRGWQRVILLSLSHWHVLLTIIIAAAILTKQQQVFAKIEQLASARNPELIEDHETPAMGHWIANHIPNAVIMCRNPWELLFYCSETNRGIGSPNPEGDSVRDAEVILAICRYYHVTHIYADSLRGPLNAYIQSHRAAFRPLEGAPGEIFQIDWNAIPNKSVEQAMGRLP